ncbi:MAG TPA: hypothetical protein ENH86_02045 [Candidatus Jorgensenbacteria bacterium]|uniref:Zinc-binding domain-containing protein n=1 Tax=marine sediment metagenome TaxID=412755 RepID=A0A0F9QN04_9ZZZZ|nr:hypothetical protein [Candidatus Jorgensenbacteria bacterium]
MNKETKQCKNCKNEFVIEPDDFAFYEKIDVPPPTWCPGCRSMRRLTWRNERAFYRHTCDLCEKSIISNLDPSMGRKVYCNKCWWSDKWDPMEYGREYDFSRPFFEQFNELASKVPWVNLWGFSNTNADYANYIAYSKNVYLSSSVVSSENIYYSYSVDKSRDVFDTFIADESELVYECVDVGQVHSVMFASRSHQCLSSYFLYDCVNCQNCFMSSNLRNKKYYFRNKLLTKEAYENKMKNIDFTSYCAVAELKEEHTDLIRTALHKFANITNSTDATGDDIEGSKNIHQSFIVKNSENIKYSWRLPGEMKDCYDISGALQSELVYEGVVAANHNYRVRFYSQFRDSKDCSYCVMGKKNTNVFGCVGIQNKQYCILNKQYTKEAYEELIPKVIAHMDEKPYVDKKGREYRYGEFFPTELSPFAYNESVAYEYFPLLKEEAEREGYRWKDTDVKSHKITKNPQELPDRITDVDNSILNETIACEHKGTCSHQCSTAFKIIPEELKFYRRINFPLPRLCPNCRHYQRLKQRNPLKLWHRQCMCDYEVYENTTKHQHHSDGRCPNEFETTYSPERKETVYCEQCYNAEIV